MPDLFSRDLLTLPPRPMKEGHVGNSEQVLVLLQNPSLSKLNSAHFGGGAMKGSGSR